MNLALILSTLLLTLAAIDSSGAGIIWDLFNGAGLVALAFFVALQVETLRGSRARGGSAVRAVADHTQLAYLALGAVAIHAIGLLVADEVSLEYVTVRAPLYMVAGLAGVALLIWLAVTSTSARRRALGTASRFQSMHRYGSLALLALVAWHVVGSGYYFDSTAVRAIVIALIAGCALMPGVVANWLSFSKTAGAAATALIATLLVGIFTAVRNY